MHIMKDLETLGTKPGCVVLSIGAVVFSPRGRQMIMQGANCYYSTITIFDQLMKGLKIDEGTVAWWQKQSPEAQAAINESARPFHIVANEFNEWVWSHTKDDNEKRLMMWANSPEFDCSIWRAACEAFGIQTSWDHRLQRDMRTWCVEAFGYDPKNTPTHGTHHNALHDAIWQAVACNDAWQSVHGGAKASP